MEHIENKSHIFGKGITVIFVIVRGFFSRATGFHFVFGNLDCETKISQAGENSEAGRAPYFKDVSVDFILLLKVWGDFRAPFAEFKLAKAKISQAGQNHSLLWPNIIWPNIKNDCNRKTHHFGKMEQIENTQEEKPRLRALE